jgi:hypothetical protein
MFFRCAAAPLRENSLRAIQSNISRKHAKPQRGITFNLSLRRRAVARKFPETLFSRYVNNPLSQQISFYSKFA